MFICAGFGEVLNINVIKVVLGLHLHNFRVFFSVAHKELKFYFAYAIKYAEI